MAAAVIAADAGIPAGAIGQVSVTALIRDITTDSRTDAMHAATPAADPAEIPGSCLWPTMAAVAVPVTEKSINGGA